MKLKLFGLAIAGLMLTAGSLQAAILSVSGGNAGVLDATFDLTASTGLTNDGTTNVTIFNNANAGSGGLFLSTDSKLTFEYLGSEAGYVNTFSVLGSDLFSKANTIGDTAQVTTSTLLSDFLLPFMLSSSGGGSATNGGPISAGLSFALANVTPTSAIILFDDGGAGTDYDDLAVRVSISQVPLPPAIWLLVSAILGLVSFSRIRRREARTA